MYGVIKATFTDNQILKLSTGYHQLHLIKHKTSTLHLTLIKIHKKPFNKIKICHVNKQIK